MSLEATELSYCKAALEFKVALLSSHEVGDVRSFYHLVLKHNRGRITYSKSCCRLRPNCFNVVDFHGRPPKTPLLVTLITNTSN